MKPRWEVHLFCNINTWSPQEGFIHGSPLKMNFIPQQCYHNLLLEYRHDNKRLTLYLSSLIISDFSTTNGGLFMSSLSILDEIIDSHLQQYLHDILWVSLWETESGSLFMRQLVCYGYS